MTTDMELEVMVLPGKGVSFAEKNAAEAAARAPGVRKVGNRIRVQL